MGRRKAAVAVFLLQGLTAVHIVPHSRFAAVMGFPAGPLGSVQRQRCAFPFRIFTKAEEKEFRKMWKTLKKEHEAGTE